MHWCSQFTDIAVDSPIPKYYLGIECKSIQTKKLYFSAHFQKDQIANMNMFLEKSGRTGYLGIEFRHRGTKSEAYLVPWHHVALKLENGESGVQKLEVPLFENVIQLTRIKEGYLFPSDF
jgi:Holliday junction resolvase